jgi:hypothetical protein
MRKLSAVVLLSAALGAGMIHAQTAPAGVTTRSIKAVQPGLFEVAGPRVKRPLPRASPRSPLRRTRVGNPSTLNRLGDPSTSVGPRT